MNRFFAALLLSFFAVLAVPVAAGATSTPAHECSELHNSNDVCPTTTTVPVAPPVTPPDTLPVTGPNQHHEDNLMWLTIIAVICAGVGGVMTVRQRQVG